MVYFEPNLQDNHRNLVGRNSASITYAECISALDSSLILVLKDGLVHQMLTLLFRYIFIFLLVLSFGLTGAFANAFPEADIDVVAGTHDHTGTHGHAKTSEVPSHDQEGQNLHDEGYESCMTLIGHCISFQFNPNSEASPPDAYTTLTHNPGDEALWASRALEVATPPPRS
ncbi:hypothetical protein ACFOW6_11525 [Fodinicurvata halophila]|uniref:Uncharacterized protein n=1 Tax=Fodinicurvata halophila TaxID=1419723 RepID=A0ABV8UNW8_9PROT